MPDVMLVTIETDVLRVLGVVCRLRIQDNCAGFVSLQVTSYIVSKDPPGFFEVDDQA